MIWYTVGDDIGAALGFALAGPDAQPVVGLHYFWTPDFIWFYLYYVIFTGIFAAFWMRYSPHRWQNWSILGSIFIIFTTYFSVQVSVAINNWRRPFFDSVQTALDPDSSVTAGDLYALIIIFTQIAFVSMGIFVITRFFVSHYIFRWRTAMNDYYMVRNGSACVPSKAPPARAGRHDALCVDDGGLGVKLIDAVMTLIAFLPVLVRLSADVTEVPILGAIPHPLVVAALLWSVVGTALLALIGIKLPGLEFPQSAGRGRLSQGTRLRRGR